jgi:energy-coupling factor transporter ATP-binding protein EcfA2
MPTLVLVTGPPGSGKTTLAVPLAGHLDHRTADEIRATLERGTGPLALGGPVLEVDTGGEVDVEAVAKWVLAQPFAAGACQT